MEVGRRPGVRGRGRGKNRRLVPKKKRADRRFRLHSAFLNSNGRARSVDHVLTAPGERPASVAGRGKWKVWTPFAILRAGFGAEASAHRDIANQIDGAGHQNSAMSRYVVSSCVIGRQAAGLQLEPLTLQSITPVPDLLANSREASKFHLCSVVKVCYT